MSKINSQPLSYKERDETHHASEKATLRNLLALKDRLDGVLSNTKMEIMKIIYQRYPSSKRDYRRVIDLESDDNGRSVTVYYEYMDDVEWKSEIYHMGE